MAKMTPFRSLLFVSVFSLASLCQADHAAGMVKWVDEQGQVHYGDQLPPEYVDKAHEVLNKQGVKVEAVEAAKTRQQLEEEERQTRLKEEQERKARERSASDKLLLDSYTSDREIIDMRDRWIGTLEDQINVARRKIETLTKQLQSHRKKAATYEDTGKPVPPELGNDIRMLEEQISQNNGHIDIQRKKQVEIRTRFDEDLQRFRELKGATGPGADNKISPANPVNAESASPPPRR